MAVEWHRGLAILLLIAVAPSCTVLDSRWSANCEIRGRVVARSTGQLLVRDAPLVVCAWSQRHASHKKPTISTLRRAGDSFSPPFLVVPVGQGVRFVNGDDICHNFFSSSEHNAFDLGLLKPRTANIVRFERPGLIHVYCSLHAGRQSSILVTPTPLFAVVGPAGEFKIEGLVPGSYVLEMWGEDVPRQRVEVTVRPSGSEFVEIEIDDSQIQSQR